MPRILKLHERQECIKSKMPVWDGKLQYASAISEKATRCLAIPKQFYEVFQDLPQSYTMTSNLSDDIFFKDFVEIKEVPKWEI